MREPIMWNYPGIIYLMKCLDFALFDNREELNVFISPIIMAIDAAFLAETHK